MNITTLLDRKQLGNWLNQHGLTGYGIEIGVAYGENAKVILDTWEGKKLFLVDPYMELPRSEYTEGMNDIDWEGRRNYGIDHLKDHADRIEWLRHRSWEVIEMISKGELDQFPPIDFVYIDGSHMRPAVDRDLADYWPLVKHGGLFGGHDFMDLHSGEYICQVKSAVTEFKNKHMLAYWNTPTCSSWWIPKTNENIANGS